MGSATVEQVLRALREQDWEVVDDVAGAPAELIPAIAKVLPELDPDGRELAVACLDEHSGPGVGALLLHLTADEDIQIAAYAAQSLLNADDIPPCADLFARLDNCEDPFVRAHLYLGAGLVGDPENLETLKKHLDKESDPDARPQALAAAVRLGDPESRETFVEMIRTATADTAEECCELLIYVDDKTAAAGLLPWLDDESDVFAIDPHGEGESIRMCDCAVWTAACLGWDVDPKPQELAKFDPSVRSALATHLRSPSPDK